MTHTYIHRWSTGLTATTFIDDGDEDFNGKAVKWSSVPPPPAGEFFKDYLHWWRFICSDFKVRTGRKVPNPITP